MHSRRTNIGTLPVTAFCAGRERRDDRYDSNLKVPFWGYASWWVRQAMQQLVAELTRPMVLSDRTLRQLAQLKRAHAEFVQRHGREPTGAELASDTGLSREQVSDLLAVQQIPHLRNCVPPQAPARATREGTSHALGL